MAATVIVLLLGALVEAQSELPREVLDLSRIKAKMNENLDRLPDYTCLETISRFHRATAASVFRHVDTVRVEVARIGEADAISPRSPLWHSALFLPDAGILSNRNAR
jgi:hypothetical protein